ncbi:MULTISPECIES: hypothetical protein [Streptomyces]|uniref:hypothetical protein n=1 Tax=Streptomyces lycopersici TaxID=2974589 RepID=UPI0021CF23BB|nr:hypothetical protein [Streptomyces sp. NEAU-383]
MFRYASRSCPTSATSRCSTARRRPAPPAPADIRRAGSGGWDAIFNTQFWVDRETGIAAVLMTQLLPSGDERFIGMQTEFERRVYDIAASASASTGTVSGSP